jgi:crotonobetainyl-CoA:carnitine CoA-transferase CaiB-like acyl-CoA transferase
MEIGEHDLALRRQPPAIGEHTGEILKELGLTLDEIAALKKDNVIALKD